MNGIENISAYKFSSTAVKDRPFIFKLNGVDITPQEFLKHKYNGGCNFGLDDLMRYGVYKILGWSFNFRPYLKRYVFLQYGTWDEAFSPNKTMLKKVVIGKIDKIIEIVD